MTLTRNGISYNFYNSPYEVQVPYENFNLIFRFSSANNVNKFKSKLLESRQNIQVSLSKRFKLNLKVDLVADLKLYNAVETRGFLIIHKDEYFECLEEVIFDGIKMTKKNSQD